MQWSEATRPPGHLTGREIIEEKAPFPREDRRTPLWIGKL